MAVGDYLKPQRSPLSVYDEQMAQMLREQSAGIGAQQIAAEAYGGKFPVGTMTSKVLSGVLARANEKRALNRDAQGKRARSLLARITAGDLPENVSIDDKGNFFTTTQKEQRIEQPPEQLQQSTYGRGLEGQMAGVPDKVVRSEIREQGMNLRGNTEENPNLLERTFFGDVKGKTIENKYDLIEEAGYDPRQYMREEKADILAQEDRQFIIEERINKKITNQLSNKTAEFKLEADTWELQNNKQKANLLKAKALSLASIDQQVLKGNYADPTEKLKAYYDLYVKEGHIKEAGEIVKMINDTAPDTLSKKEKITFYDKFREEEQKNFAAIEKTVNTLSQLKIASEGPTGASSYAMMIKFIKALDDSVVRSSEVDAFGKFLGAVTNIENKYTIFTGSGFTDEVKEAMYEETRLAVDKLIRDYNTKKMANINDFYQEEDFDPAKIYAGREGLDTTGLGVTSIVNVEGNPIYGEPITMTNDELTKQVYQQNRQEEFNERESDETIGALDANTIKDFSARNVGNREQQIEEAKKEIQKAKTTLQPKEVIDYLKKYLSSLMSGGRN